jgi:hypothetical protein
LAVAKAKPKTDKVDAAISAQPLAARYLPSVSMPDAATSALLRQALHPATQPLRKIAQIADTTFYTRSRSPTTGGIVLGVARIVIGKPRRSVSSQYGRTAPGPATPVSGRRRLT